MGVIKLRPRKKWNSYCHFCGFDGYGEYLTNSGICWCKDCFDKQEPCGPASYPTLKEEMSELGICSDCIEKVLIWIKGK